MIIYSSSKRSLPTTGESQTLLESLERRLRGLCCRILFAHNPPGFRTYRIWSELEPAKQGRNNFSHTCKRVVPAVKTTERAKHATYAACFTRFGHLTHETKFRFASHGLVLFHSNVIGGEGVSCTFVPIRRSNATAAIKLVRSITAAMTEVRSMKPTMSSDAP